MSRLFIANVTRQNQVVYYRLDFNPDGTPNLNRHFQPAKRSPAIAPGRQIPIGGDLHVTQITSIVDQLNRFGMAGANETGRLNGFTPYLFNIDQPVPVNAIRAAVRHNDGIRIKEGNVRRENAAVAAASVAKTEDFTVEIEQEPGESEGPTLEQGFHVVKDANEVPRGRRGHAKGPQTA